MNKGLLVAILLVGLLGEGARGAVKRPLAVKPKGSKAKVEEAKSTPEQKRLIKKTFGFTILTLQSETLGLDIAKKAKDAGGYLKSLSNEALDVVIPVDRVEAFARDIAASGSIAARTEANEDVTRQWVDTEAKLRSREKLLKDQLAALDGVGRIQDLGDIEQEITETIEGVESLKGAARLMEHQLKFAGVHVDFHFRKMDETAQSGSSFRWVDSVDFAPLLQSM